MLGLRSRGHEQPGHDPALVSLGRVRPRRGLDRPAARGDRSAEGGERPPDRRHHHRRRGALVGSRRRGDPAGPGAGAVDGSGVPDGCGRSRDQVGDPSVDRRRSGEGGRTVWRQSGRPSSNSSTPPVPRRAWTGSCGGSCDEGSRHLPDDRRRSGRGVQGLHGGGHRRVPGALG